MEKEAPVAGGGAEPERLKHPADHRRRLRSSAFAEPVRSRNELRSIDRRICRKFTSLSL